MAGWQIFTAVAMRRLPEIMPRRDPIETRIQQIFDALEAAKSRYSAHELRHLEDKRIQESEDTDVIIKETAQDLEDRWMKEKSEFQFGEYDDRLSKSQYLFIQSKFGTDIKDQWLLPQTAFDRKLGDKDLLDTARRALIGSLNINTGYRIISKVPASSIRLNYPKKVQDITGFQGALVFYLKAHLDLPDASVKEAVDETKNANLKWLTLEEASKEVSATYFRGLAKGMLREDRINVDEVLKKASKYVASARKLSINAN